MTPVETVTREKSANHAVQDSETLHRSTDERQDVGDLIAMIQKLTTW